MLTTLYLVRHAHPLQNSGIAYDRVPGPPLDDIGRAEAARTAQFLRNCGLHALLCSPLERTRQTAAAISAATGITAVIDDALAEHRSDERFEDVSTRTAAWLARIEQHVPPASTCLRGAVFRRLACTIRRRPHRRRVCLCAACQPAHRRVRAHRIDLLTRRRQRK